MASPVWLLVACAAALVAAGHSPYRASHSYRVPLRLRGGVDDEAGSAEAEDTATPVEEKPKLSTQAPRGPRGGPRGPRGPRSRSRGRGAVAGRGRARGRARGAAAVRAPATAQPAAESAAPAPVSLPTWWRDLTAWDDPVTSGIVFGVVNVAFYVTVLNRWSAASLLGALSLYGLLCAAVAVTATRLLRSVGYPPVGAVVDAACDALPAMLRQPGDAALLDVELAAEVGRGLASVLNSGFEALRLLATVANPLATAGALLGALLVKSFGKHVGVLGLLWAAFVVAYAWPAVQSSFGTQLEELLEQALAFAAPATAALQLIMGL